MELLKLMKLKSKLSQLVPIPHHQSKRRKATKRELAPRGVLNEGLYGDVQNGGSNPHPLIY